MPNVKFEIRNANCKMRNLKVKWLKQVWGRVAKGGGGCGCGCTAGVIIKALEYVSMVSLLEAESPSKSRALTLDSVTDLCESRFESVNLYAIKDSSREMCECVCVYVCVGMYIVEYTYVCIGRLLNYFGLCQM